MHGKSVKHILRILTCTLLLCGPLTTPQKALAAESEDDYTEQLTWSQMETELLDGNNVEWHLDIEEIDTEAAAEAAIPQWRISLTTEQLDLLERCVMAEGGGESYECQKAIACVIINRVLSNKYPDTVEAVITQKSQFSTWPTQIRNAEVSNEVKQAVREALTTAVIPEDILYFRADHYHSWAEDCCRIDNTYFSS